MAVQTLHQREEEARVLAEAFAAKYDTPNVRLAVEYARYGRLAWSDVAALFARSYGTAVREVAS
jgi:hypothetical protein